MSGKNIIFNDKKINNGNFYKNKKKLVQLVNVDVNKILVSKKSHKVKKVHLNILMDMMIMMTLCHYL